jgi:hypothetical protein
MKRASVAAAALLPLFVLMCGGGTGSVGGAADGGEAGGEAGATPACSPDSSAIDGAKAGATCDPPTVLDPLGPCTVDPSLGCPVDLTTEPCHCIGGQWDCGAKGCPRRSGLPDTCPHEGMICQTICSAGVAGCKCTCGVFVCPSCH